MAYSSIGKHNKALSLYNQLLSNIQAIKPGSTTEMIRSLDIAGIHLALAKLRESQNQLEEAESHYRDFVLLAEKLDTSERAGPRANSSDKITALISLAEITYKKRKNEIASELYNSARDLLLSDPSLPQVPPTIATLASSYLAKGYFHDALFLLREQIMRHLRYAQSSFLLQLPSQRIVSLHYDADNSLSMLFSNAVRSPDAAELSLHANLNYTGLLLDVEKQVGLLSRASKSLDSKVARLRELTFILGDPSLTESYRIAISTERSELESELYRRLPSLRVESITSAQLAKHLSENGALIAFQRYQRWQPIQPPYHSGMWGIPTEYHYLALVLLESGSIYAVDLGPATHLEKLVSSAIAASRTPGVESDEVQAAWHRVKLYLFPNKLLAGLKGSNTWIISADAQLSNIPFFAIPSPHALNRRLSEVVRIQIVTSGRDLVENTSQSKNIARNPPLVLADPAYGQSLQGPWRRLASSRNEGIAIASRLGVKPRLGAEASEDTLKEQKSINPSLLHVASHAYFGDPSSIPAETLNGQRRPRIQQGRSPDLFLELNLCV